ncbi:MAG TPA: DUF692 family protein [Thermoanaerobaculia bacterium]|nr:DUF692 family protein [Thermoanaerobaculia bacterium]
MIRVGVNYEGRDPRFVGTVLPFADVVEVTPDAIATLRDSVPVIPDETMSELRAIARSSLITLHGVGMSIASADTMNDDYFRLTDTLMQELDPAWHSEHIGYVSVDGKHLGTMLVPPRTDEALALICTRVETVLGRYAKPFLLEHAVNLFPDAGGDYTPAGFLNEIVRRTGCGLLLDVYNLECDAHNGVCSANAFLDEIDLDAIREIHVACGTEDRGLQVDVHSRTTRDETVALLQQVLAVAPNVEAVIFELLGPAVPSVGYTAIGAELQRVRAAVHGVEPASRRPRVAQTPKPAVGRLPLREHQRAMQALLHGQGETSDPYIAAAAASTGLEVTRDTIRGWRQFRLDRHCRLTTSMLRRRSLYDEVLNALDRAPASPYIEELAEGFFAAVGCRDALVTAVAAFERALLRDDDLESVIEWPCDPYPILGALLQGEAITDVPAAPYRTVVSRATAGRFRVEPAS